MRKIMHCFWVGCIGITLFFGTLARDPSMDSWYSKYKNPKIYVYFSHQWKKITQWVKDHKKILLPIVLASTPGIGIPLEFWYRAYKIRQKRDTIYEKYGINLAKNNFPYYALFCDLGYAAITKQSTSPFEKSYFLKNAEQVHSRLFREYPLLKSALKEMIELPPVRIIL